MDFTSVHNVNERSIYDAVQTAAADYPAVQALPDLLADVACVALNRVPPRYVRHDVDLAFFQTAKEQQALDKTITMAVQHAFGFVQARHAMRARR